MTRRKLIDRTIKVLTTVYLNLLPSEEAINNVTMTKEELERTKDMLFALDDQIFSLINEYNKKDEPDETHTGLSLLLVECQHEVERLLKKLEDIFNLNFSKQVILNVANEIEGGR